MKFQEYQAPRLTLGVVGVIAILIPILLGYFLVSGLANSSSYQFPNVPSGATTATTNSTSTTAPTTIVQVSMPKGAGNPSGAPGYAPDNITVIIGINNTVNWTNNDVVAHTVTAVNTTNGNPIFNSANMPPGAMFNYTFTTPGYYPYICAYHPWMKGSVTVKSSTTTPIAIIQVSMPKGAGNPSGAPGYAPDNITVIIGINNTVNWTNNDVVAHTVTAVNTTDGNPIFNSANMPPGAMFNYTFTTPGYYLYTCSYHPWMDGSVKVLTGSGSSSSASTTSSSSATTTISTSSSSSSAAANALMVSIPKGSGLPSGAPGFAPDNITLVIGVNNTVTWTNNDTVHHTVTSTSVPSGATSFNSGDMAPGATFTYTLAVPGVYQYDCIYHPWMTATITVVQG